MKVKMWLIIIPAVMSSCRTVDFEKKVIDVETGNLREDSGVVYVPVREIVEVERPVYVPEREAPVSRPLVSGAEAVRASNGEGIIRPTEYSHASMIYWYDKDWVYEVYTQPLRVSDIKLEAEEKVMETPFISDSERWILGAGVSYENGEAVQHIYVKPAQASLEASLIINTDRRVYHIILKSYSSVYMPMVRWKYPVSGLPERYISREEAEEAVSDPRYLSFNYRVRYGLFRKPKWLPRLVYDDGKKTYITFSEDVLRGELPSVFEERENVVNYRVLGTVIIIDKLIEKITVRLDGREIEIEKKRG